MLHEYFDIQRCSVHVTLRLTLRLTVQKTLCVLLH